jgi:GH18 family chitinase
MPCNSCRSRQIPFRNQHSRQIGRNIGQPVQKVEKVEQVDKTQNIITQNDQDSDPPTISSINITGGSLVINYKGGSPTPTDKTYEGYLNNVAYEAIGGSGKIGKPEDNKYRSVGYYGIGFGGNSQKGGEYVSKLTLDQLDLKTYTHINVAFFALDKDANIVYPGGASGNRGSVADPSKPQWLQHALKAGKGNPTDEAYEIISALNDQVETYVKGHSGANIPVLLPSIGGWDISNNEFYGQNLIDIAQNFESHKPTYQTSINKMMDLPHVGGLDIDWEYPGRFPMLTWCQKGTTDVLGNPCKIGEPTSIGPCSDKSTNCISYKQIPNTPQCDCTNGATFHVPDSKMETAHDPNKYIKSQVDNYSIFMKGTKNIITDKGGVLTIAMAGAPWGWHWSANTISKLIIGNTIDFVNIMAYDYFGWWTNGVISGFLGNLTNHATIDACNPDNLSKEKCQYVGGCQNKNCRDGNCFNKYKITYTKAGNNLTYNTNKGLGCPTTYYNIFRDPGSDITSAQQNAWTGSSSEAYWQCDNNLIIKGVNLHDPCNTSLSTMPRLTLSTQSMVDAFKNIFKIPYNKMVIGLPYYGRTFQTKAGEFAKDTYGLYQPYYIGGPYSYYDIHRNFIKDNNSNDVYSMELKKNEYTEEFIYTKALMNKFESTMGEEFISYGSETTTIDKIKYIKNTQLGGYMAWHMLSDYFDIKANPE